MAFWTKIRQFVWDQQKLPRQLSQFEDGVEAAIADIWARVPKAFAVILSTSAIHQAKLGEAVRMPGAGSVRLPAASELNTGRTIVIERMSASGAVSVFAVNQTVNGVSSDTLPTAIGAWMFLSMGDSWARIGRT